MKNDKKNVAIFSRGLTMNGATKSLVELLKRLDYKKINLDLYILSFEGANKDLMEQIPSEVNLLEVPRYTKSINTFFSIFKHPIHFSKSLEAKKFLSHKEMIMQWKATAARLPKIEKKYDIAISYRHFDIDVFYVKNNLRADKKIFWIHGVQQLNKKEIATLEPIYNSYDRIFPVSYAAKSNIIKFFPNLEKKCNVAYCIVDAKEIKSQANLGEIFSEHSNILNILTIGRLNKEKGMDLAIEACEILRNRGFKFKWSVCGDGDQKDNLKKMIKSKNLDDYFILLGHVNNPYGYLKTCDIYVQPSYLESYCLTINEAKIFNKPIVASNIAAMREQISNNIDGLLSDLDAECFADKIQILLEDNVLRNKLSVELSKNEYSHFEVLEVLTSVF